MNVDVWMRKHIKILWNYHGFSTLARHKLKEFYLRTVLYGSFPMILHTIVLDKLPIANDIKDHIYDSTIY